MNDGGNSMGKATNDGTCQICERRQRLPRGVMAKHGYTVDYGYFNGTCYGSENLPFEQSRDMLAPWIKRVEDHLRDLNARIVRFSAPATEPVSEHNAYVQDSRGKGSYAWVKVTLRDTGNGEVELGYTNPFTGKPEAKASRQISIYGTPLQVADQLNVLYVDYLHRVVEMVERDLTRLRNRYDTWTARPLLPLTEFDPSVREGRDERVAAREAKKAADAAKKAERARKLIAKYEVAVPEDVRATLGTIDRRAMYDIAGALQLSPSVEDVLLAEWERATEEPRPMYTSPYVIVERFEAGNL
jgi:hypothetical protein